jgi:hypothetical protein
MFVDSLPENRQRRNLTVKLRYDEAKTWPVARTLESGMSGYADLAVGPDGTIFCFYERGALGKNMYKTAALTVARFLEWLTEGKIGWTRHRNKSGAACRPLQPMRCGSSDRSPR